jgi:hypothetical protein
MSDTDQALVERLHRAQLFSEATTVQGIIRERDEARHDRDEALDYAQTIIETYMKERDEALAEAAEYKQALNATHQARVEGEKQARAKAIEEAAAAFRRCAPGAMLAGDVDHVEAYILALRDKPTVQE